MIQIEPMFFRYLIVTVLIAPVLAGCAVNTTSHIYSPPNSESKNIYDVYKKPRLDRLQKKPALKSSNKGFYSEVVPYGLFFHEPSLETWKSYYYFLHLRAAIKDFPRVVPETEYDIPVVFNDKIHHFLEYFQGRGRESFSIWLSRSGKYIPMMKVILEQWRMPTDLVYMAMIESGFNVKARSHMGAVGPWQFIQATGKRYGLRIDSWVDERMDPEKSTIAAANYLSDLYDMFQSWELAAAGYNCGEERVQAAIDRYDVSDFWEISEYTLPKETKDYVPKFMAALIIAKDPEKYGFNGIEYQDSEPVERVQVPSQRSLGDIARVIGVSSSRLTEMNPGLITGSTPPGDPYEINIPLGYRKVVVAKYDEIAALKVMTARVRTTTHSSYRVRRGDTLGRIASRYGVSVSSLRRANGIRGSLIKTGQLLTIPGGTGRSYSRVYSSSIKYRVRPGDTLGGIAVRYGSTVSSIKAANGISGSFIRVGQLLTIPRGGSAYSGGDPLNYHVKRGDTLWDIARRYRVSISDIKRWNNLRSSKIALGDKLTIYTR
ncbi:MAG TPA: LysM peptidoglycan-binding domain-containing protein [Thermodesulfobacteriota bacterium]|nr:LysM peptidoglycan-binding domain-containing protein [Thermodesulfobacteriota bacterium]